MSDTSSTVTFTSVYTVSEPWRYYGEDSAETGPLRVIVYGYDGLPIQPLAPLSPDYVPGPEHPPSPDYVPGPEHPPSPIEIPYVPEPEYPEYLAPYDDEEPLEDQPLPADASPIVASPDYVVDSDPKEDPEDDQVDYPVNGEDGDDEPFDDDDDDADNEDPEEEPFEEDGGEEEHPAPADSSIVPIVDLVLSAGETEALEVDEHTHAPGSPIRAPLGYRAAKIRMRALLPSTSRRTDILETGMPPWKKACLTTLALGFEIGESSVAGTVRQLGPTESDLRRCRVEQAGYEITDTWDDILTTALGHIEILEARDPEPQEGPAEAGSSCVVAVLAERDADKSRNGDNSNDSGTGERRQMTTPRECSYIDFLKCQPMSFQGTEGVIGSALTWWNSHIRAVRHDVSYAMPWAALKRMITDKYCPRDEIQKLEFEYWNLKVKGIDLLNYNHRF
nr:hypothetical protein [Tanacetum cinerariifolium]